MSEVDVGFAAGADEHVFGVVGHAHHLVGHHLMQIGLYKAAIAIVLATRAAVCNLPYGQYEIVAAPDDHLVQLRRPRLRHAPLRAKSNATKTAASRTRRSLPG